MKIHVSEFVNMKITLNDILKKQNKKIGSNGRIGEYFLVHVVGGSCYKSESSIEYQISLLFSSALEKVITINLSKRKKERAGTILLLLVIKSWVNKWHPIQFFFFSFFFIRQLVITTTNCTMMMTHQGTQAGRHMQTTLLHCCCCCCRGNGKYKYNVISMFCLLFTLETSNKQSIFLSFHVFCKTCVNKPVEEEESPFKQ